VLTVASLLPASILPASTLLGSLVLDAQPLSAQSGAPASPAQLRRQAARRFLRSRSILGHRAARQLAQARTAHQMMKLAPAAKSAYAPALLSQPWHPLGPAQVSTNAYGLVTGRVTSIAADPSDSTGNTVYLGTTGGGVWKSTNAAGPPDATAFTPLTDDLSAFTSGSVAALSIGAVSVQPGATGVILAGTGDPNDALDSYYGAGLLRSADGGLTWSLISKSNDLSVNSLSNFYFFGLAFAGFAWSTQTPNLVVAALSQSAEGGIVAANLTETEQDKQLSVMGLYYSTDAGQSWLLATITDGPGQIVQVSDIPISDGGNAATAVVWNPVRKRFYAAVRFHGYYESLNGITFTRLANQPGIGLTTTECPTNPSASGSSACPISRGALAVQPATGDLFALTVDTMLDRGLWQDVCAAASGACASSTVTFGKQLSTTALDDDSGAIPAGDYSLSLAAVPVFVAPVSHAPASSDTLLFAATTDIFRCSLAAGCIFRNTTNTATCAAAMVAPFQHALDTTFAATTLAANHPLMYFGNDSGLWRSTDNVDQTQPPCNLDDAKHFQNLNAGLGSLAEVQGLAQDPANSAILLAGLGVNGDAASTTSGKTVWPQVLDGYGSYVAIDPANSKNWYVQSSSGVAIDLCPDGSSCAPARFGTPVIGFAQVGADAYAFPEPAPFLLDPQSSANLILGTCHLWRGPADGDSWSDANLLGDLYPAEGPECDGNALIQSLAASGTVSTPAGNTEYLYAGLAGFGIQGPQAYAGHLFTAAVSDATLVPASWTDLWLSPVANEANGFNPQDFSISSITSDAHDSTGQTLYVTIQGFSTLLTPTGTVYASTNGGAAWTNITSNLPEAPANSIVIDPNDANTLYVALDTGVYITTAVTTCATENCWSIYGSGLPNSPVVQLAAFHSGGQSLLRAGTYGRGIWQVPLITAAATITTVTAAPASLSFPAQQMQTQSSAQSITLTNTGAIAMLVRQVSVGGDFAAVNNCGASVAAGASCTVQVTFTPTATGARAATLTIYLNIVGGQVAIPLTGTGIPGGAIVLLPTSMNFGSSLIGVTTKPAQNITISNTGGVAVNLQLPIATGDFAITANTCAASLAPNFGCTVALAFTPTVSGRRSGAFSVTDDAGTQTATLSGIGLAPATDTISPTTLSFAPQLVGTASAGQAVTLTNSGDSPLNSISVSIQGDFQAVNSCGNSLVGHASCAITVTFVPTKVGAEIGTLTIDDMYGKPQTVTLSGSGIAPAGISALPAMIDFGPWGLSGASPAQTVTVTNSGGVALDAFTLSTTGDFATTAATTCPLSPSASTLAPGSSCAVQVVFSPTQPGPLTGTLVIASSSATPPFQIALSGNGFSYTFAAQGASSVTIASGQTATYMLQLTPAAGSAGPVAFACGAAPSDSTCTVNPASLQLTSGVTASATVTITTIAATRLDREPRPSGPLLFLAGCLPFEFLLHIRRRPRSRLSAVILLALVFFSLGCGVTASGGSSGSTTKGTGTVPSTYNPVITATGDDVTQSVTLTLIVD
jgi:hypothetical protein